MQRGSQALSTANCALLAAARQIHAQNEILGASYVGLKKFVSERASAVATSEAAGDEPQQQQQGAAAASSSPSSAAPQQR